MLSIYKRTTLLSIIISSIALCVSLLLAYEKSPICVWVENICIGVFASGLLLVFSSILGYFREEKHLLREYHWKISALKECAVELVTIPKNEISNNEFYNAIRNLNTLLTDYFAIIDTDFWCYKRKEIQKLLEIHTKLEPLKHMTSNAFLKLCEYRCGKLNDEGDRNYSFESFKKDIQSFIDAVDNFSDSGMKLAIWLETKEREYGEVVFKYNFK